MVKLTWEDRSRRYVGPGQQREQQRSNRMVSRTDLTRPGARQTNSAFFL